MGIVRRTREERVPNTCVPVHVTGRVSGLFTPPMAERRTQKARRLVVALHHDHPAAACCSSPSSL